MRRLFPLHATLALALGMALGWPSTGGAAQPAPLVEARRAAVAFLERVQEPDGSYPAELCLPASGRCRPSATVFTAAMVLYSIGEATEPAVREVLRRGKAFLEAERQPGGLWRFVRGRGPEAVLPPDCDDTALASFLLAGQGERMPNRDRFAANRDGEGRFHTWFRDPGEKNDVDSVVNANALMYLGDGPDTAGACAWLISLLREGREEGTFPYYVHATDLYYALARAHARGAACLGPAMPAIRERVLSLVGPDGSVGGDVQHTLLGALALAYAGHLGPPLEAMRAFAVGRQQADGSFPASDIFAGPEPPAPRTTFWRSAAITTALAVELLSLPSPGQGRNGVAGE